LRREKEIKKEEFKEFALGALKNFKDNVQSVANGIAAKDILQTDPSNYINPTAFQTSLSKTTASALIASHCSRASH